MLIRSVGDMAVGRADPNKALNELRKHVSAGQAGLAWDMALLRERGKSKFGAGAAGMLFTKDGLEMASGSGPALYHARRLKELGIDHVIDLCSGIGGDALAFAAAGMNVTMVDLDPLHLQFATANAKALGLSSLVNTAVGDASSPSFISDLALAYPGAALWFDPARRTGGKRTVQPEAYAPPLSMLNVFALHDFPIVGVKLAPSIDHSLSLEYGASLEFLSHNGECKEGLLWISKTVSAKAPIRAVLLKGDNVLVLEGISDTQGGARESRSPLVQTQSNKYLFEPDPAVIRAHLVQRLAVDLQASSIDPQIAYLVGDTPAQSPFAQCYPVIEKFSYSRRTLQEVVTRNNVGHLIVKKRGVPVEPEEIISQLKLKGETEKIAVITREGSSRVGFLCEKPLVMDGIGADSE